MKLGFEIIEGSFSIHRLSPDSKIPGSIFQDPFYSISRTDEELSIVCSSSQPVVSEISDTGWYCIRVLGPLDFSLTGILAGISSALAAAGISIFAISTYNTDYILVKSENLKHALKVLQYD